MPRDPGVTGLQIIGKLASIDRLVQTGLELAAKGRQPVLAPRVDVTGFKFRPAYYRASRGSPLLHTHRPIAPPQFSENATPEPSRPLGF